MDQPSLPGFPDLGDKRQPCKNCGKPTTSQYGYCKTNPECKSLQAAAWYKAKHPAAERETQPCQRCGKPTASPFGYCVSTPECRRVYADAWRGGTLPTIPCKNCGKPTRSANGYCNRTPACHSKSVMAGTMTATCNLCGGPTGRNTKYGFCTKTAECRKAARAAVKDAFMAAHPGYEVQARNRRRNSLILKGASRRAAEAGIPFSLTEADLPPVPDACPVFGTPFHVPDGTSKGGPVPASRDLDKIIPALGYVPGNVQWISHKANLMKRDATPEELLQFADWIYATFRSVTRTAAALR